MGKRILRRLFAILLLGLIPVFPATANQWRCFDTNDDWCAWTVRASQPELGWGVVHKARLPGLVVETVVDSQLNIPALRVYVSPVPASEDVRVILSIRQSLDNPHRWKTFTGPVVTRAENTAQIVYSRAALEALIEAPATARLYVFVELRSKTTNHKASHKVDLDSLNQALRFARLGR